MRTPSTNTHTRHLGLLGATGVGVGAIVGGGILALAGVAFATTGPSAILAFGLNGVVAMLTAVSFAELASRFPESGGTYTHARKVLTVEAAFAAESPLPHPPTRPTLVISRRGSSRPETRTQPLRAMSRRDYPSLAVLTAVLLAVLTPTGTDAQGSRFLRQPTVSADLIAFVHANDIWTVGRDGGNATRLLIEEVA